jgi:tetratricopeptide (TPR) repeat protein
LFRLKISLKRLSIIKALIVWFLTAFFAFAADSAEEAFDRGNAAYSKSEYKEAIKRYTQAIAISPILARTSYYNRANAYADLGDYSKAIADYSQAIEIDPNYAAAYESRGNAYRLFGDLRKATAEARKACELGACGLLQFMEKEKLLRD